MTCIALYCHIHDLYSIILPYIAYLSSSSGGQCLATTQSSLKHNKITSPDSFYNNSIYIYIYMTYKNILYTNSSSYTLTQGGVTSRSTEVSSCLPLPSPPISRRLSPPPPLPTPLPYGVTERGTLVLLLLQPAAWVRSDSLCGCSVRGSHTLQSLSVPSCSSTAFLHIVV